MQFSLSYIRRSDRQSGAAMIEFIIAALFFLVPLFLAVQVIGKFADVQHGTDAAARYAAWERIVWFNDNGSAFANKNAPNKKSDAEILHELRKRVFNDRHSALVYSDEDKKAPKKDGKKTPTFDPLWTDNSGTPYLSDYAKAATVSTRASTPDKDYLGKVLEKIQVISVPEVFDSAVPPVTNKTLTQSTFTLKDIAKDSVAYKRLWSPAHGLAEWQGVSMSSQAAVLTNTWGANSNKGTRAMVQPVVPTAQLLGKTIGRAATAVMVPWQPTLIAQPLDMGRIGPDVVPGDRLK